MKFYFKIEIDVRNQSWYIMVNIRSLSKPLTGGDKRDIFFKLEVDGKIFHFIFIEKIASDSSH